MKPSAGFPLFRPVAEHGILVEMGDASDPDVLARIRHLDLALRAAGFDGFVEAVPAFVNLLVEFDPQRTDHRAAERHLRRLIDDLSGPDHVAAHHEVSVCYDPEFSPDLSAVAAACGLDEEAVIAAHLAGGYEVVMYGFAPGYAYLSGVPAPLHLPRKPSAVRGVAAGSVIIAGAQCLVTTLTMPTGWWVLGRSPTMILRSDRARPFLFDVGDAVRLRRISRDDFEKLWKG